MTTWSLFRKDSNFHLYALTARCPTNWATEEYAANVHRLNIQTTPNGVTPDNQNVPAVAVVFLVIAAGMSIIAGALMIRKSVTARTSDGLSTGLIILGLLLGPMWLAYGVGNHNVPQAVSSLIWAIVYTLWWAYWFTDRGRPFWMPVAIMTVWSAVLIGLALVPGFPWQTFGWIGGILGVISNVPQLVKAFRTDHRGDGFSMRGWIANTTSIASWVVYAIIAGDTPVIFTNSVTLALMIAIVVRTQTLPVHQPPVVAAED